MPNIAFDDLKRVSDYIKGYQSFPFPVVICSPLFQVIWSNSLANLKSAMLTETESLKEILSEFDPILIREELEQKGSVMLSHVLSLEDMRLSFLPIYENGTLSGIIIILLRGEDLIGDSVDTHLSATPFSLVDQAVTTAENIFLTLDHLSEKSAILGMEWVDEHLNRIAQHSYHGLRSVTNINEYIRLQSGETSSRHRKPVGLFGWLEEISGTVAEIASGVGVSVTFNIPGDECCVCLDMPRFEIAFFNILHNAITYSQKPGHTVSVSGSMSASELFLLISDSGCGIPDDIKNFIFRPYFSFSHHNVPVGIGLGLTVSKRIISYMGGSVELKDTGPGGSTFLITLPIGAFSQSLPLGQVELNDSGILRDRFSPLYIGLAGLGNGQNGF